jgi:hypothetical protein
MLLVSQAPAIVVLLLVSLGTSNLGGHPGEQPRSLLVVLMLAASAIGLVNACREIVREAPIYRRERTVGLSLGAYLGSKFLCLGALAAIQSCVLAGVVLAFQGGPPSSVILSPPAVEVGVMVFLATIAAVALGLAVSALVQNDSAALVMIPVLIVAQLVMSNAFLDVESRPVLAQASWAMPTHWGFRGAAASSNMIELEGKCALLKQAGGVVIDDADRKRPKTFLGDLPCSPHWLPTKANVLFAAFALVLVSGGYAAIAAAALRRRDPYRHAD